MPNIDRPLDCDSNGIVEVGKTDAAEWTLGERFMQGMKQVLDRMPEWLRKPAEAEQKRK